MQKKYYKWGLFLGLLVLLLAGSIAAGLCIGEIRFSLRDIGQLWSEEQDINK